MNWTMEYTSLDLVLKTNVTNETIPHKTFISSIYINNKKETSWQKKGFWNSAITAQVLQKWQFWVLDRLHCMTALANTRTCKIVPRYTNKDFTKFKENSFKLWKFDVHGQRAEVYCETVAVGAVVVFRRQIPV